MWKRGEDQTAAFTASKELLTSKSCLTHFDSSLPLILACDALAYGLGAVLSHLMPDGSERPIGYASRTLTQSEQNYSQLKKERLSCILGIKKFHHYVFGRSFQLITDHKPLLGLLRENKTVFPQASARIKCWSLFLSSYEYTLTFRNTTAHANADALSWLPLPEEPAKTTTEPELVLLAEHLEDLPVTAADIRVWTKKDKKLSKVLRNIQCGWPSDGDSTRTVFISTSRTLVLWRLHFVGNQDSCTFTRSWSGIARATRGHPGITKI